VGYTLGGRRLRPLRKEHRNTQGEPLYKGHQTGMLDGGKKEKKKTSRKKKNWLPERSKKEGFRQISQNGGDVLHRQKSW